MSHSPPEKDTLCQIQIEIARILTDSRTKLIDGGQFKLSSSELEQSREILVRKRISQMRHCLPRTASAMGTEFNLSFREFAGTHHFNGSNAITMDAIVFSTWLGDSKIALPWIKQLALWESMDSQWPMAKIYVKFFRFQYDFSRPFESGEPKIRRSYWCCMRVFAWSRKLRIMG